MQDPPGSNTPGSGEPGAPPHGAPLGPGPGGPGPGPGGYSGPGGPGGPSPIPPTPPTGGGKGMIGRARDILTRPAAEWPVVDGEAATMVSLIVPYALILAAIPPLALLLGLLVFTGAAASFLFGIFLQMAIAFYVVNVAVVIVLGLAIDALAPTFGGTKNNVQALKLAVYSSTPLWVGGIILLLVAAAPILYWLWFLGGFGYGAYLLYLGLPRLMRVSGDKAQTFAAAAIGIWFVLLIIGRALAGAMMGGPFSAF